MKATSVRVREGGTSSNWRAGRLPNHYARVKRQVEKLLLLGKYDLVPGRWLLRKHMQERTEFSSNIKLDKL